MKMRLAIIVSFIALKVSAFIYSPPYKSTPISLFTHGRTHRHILLLEATTDASDNADDNNQFAEWENEEIELLKQNILNANKIDDDDDDSDNSISKSNSKSSKQMLPDYMMRILQDYNEDPIIIDEEAIPIASLPVLAIIGRPNTGKSTIVNKLTDSYKDGAIVHDASGITRDRTYRTSTWNNYNFQVVDTGGIVFEDTIDVFAKKITEQSLYALNEATAAIMVCDGIEGLHPLDIALAEYLRKKNKTPLYLAINKCESETRGILQAQDFWALGLGNPYPVSGIHGTGLSDLLDEITTKHIKKITKVIPENATNIAFVGRPNVGKSSLFNRLIGEERSIVSDVAGTTRDTVDALLSRGQSQYRIIDTAGVCKRGKVEYGPEFFMVNRVFKAIRRSDVVILLLDATSGIVEQDRILADRIATEGRSCVIALNKWDIVPEKDEKTYLKAIENIRSNLPVLRWAEIVLMSAVTGLRTEKLFDAVERASIQFKRRVPTAIINEIVQDATLWMAPPTIGARAGRIYYCMQISASPPTIVFFVNDPALFTDNYQRFLERKIRDALNLEGTPIKMIWRGKALRDVSRATVKGEGSTRRMTGGEGGWQRRPQGVFDAKTKK